MIDKNVMQAAIETKLLSTELEDNDTEYMKRRLEHIHSLLVAYCGGPECYKEHLYDYFGVYNDNRN